MSEQDQAQPDEQQDAAETPAARPEQEYHPADPRFNPAHPDNAAWRSGPKPPDMPAEAGIVAMFQDPAGAISEDDVRIEPPPAGPEFQRDPEPETSGTSASAPAEQGAQDAAGEAAADTAGPAAGTDESTASDTATTTKKPARRTR